LIIGDFLMKRVSLSYYLRVGLEVLHENGFRAILDPVNALQRHTRVADHKRDQSLLKSLNYSSVDLARNRELLAHFSKSKGIQVKTVNWFIPDFARAHAYGGIYTILRFADYFHTTKGVKNRLVFYGNPQAPETVASEGEIKNRISGMFPNLLSDDIIPLTDYDLNTVPQGDISIATFWTSAYLLLKFNKTEGKFYFIQDYEPSFYPAGTLYALAEATYRFGFYGIVNSHGLYDLYMRDYGGVAEYFTPSVDEKVFYPSHRTPSRPSVQNPFTIFFYARAGDSRNAFELGVVTLQEIKRRYGELVRIYAAGSKWDSRTYDPENAIVNLGVLPYEKTAPLYRKCDLGIVFTLSKHPSYIPFELMACGCPVLANYNSVTKWFLKDGFNCMLSEPSVSHICDKVDTLIRNPDLRKQLIMNALDSMPRTSWNQEAEKVYRFICNIHAK